jgi:DeoR family transcriptional regulator, suf operon transcriptional repressor
VVEPAPGVPGLASLPAARRAILTAVKSRGDARAEDLAKDLGVSVSAMRQHLSSLASDGLIQHQQVRDGRGRPRHLYHLTERADSLFPRTYAEITNELLSYVDEADHELLEKVFRKRRDRRIRQANARLAGKPFDERVAELARILDEDGYLATVETGEDGSFRIVEHNCAILGVARRYNQACTSEIEFIRSVLPDAEVTRVSHIVAGARHCGYLVVPRARRAPAWA